jgi:hypothetical protein
MNVPDKLLFRGLNGLKIREWKEIDYTKKISLKRPYKST